MDKTIDLFNKRWVDIEKEVLSSVRRQLKAYDFDNSEVNRDFQKSCNEWFNGKLAPSIWFKKFSSLQPEKASSFKSYIENVILEGIEISKPKSLWAYFATALSLPITYGVLDYVTEWEFLSKCVFAIGFAVLLWAGFKSILISKSNKYNDMIVGYYQKQIEKHGDKIRKIIL